MPNILSGAPSRVPGAPSSVPGSANLGAPRSVGGLLTRIPDQPTSGMFAGAHRQQLRDVRGRFAGNWGVAWTGLQAMGDALEAWEGGIYNDLHQAAEKLAEDMVAYAQENAPWEDRTGNARAGLQSYVVWTGETQFTIFLSHGEDIYYGVWLEVMQGGRFAILVPTLEHFAPQFSGYVRAH